MAPKSFNKTSSGGGPHVENPAGHAPCAARAVGAGVDRDVRRDRHQCARGLSRAADHHDRLLSRRCGSDIAARLINTQLGEALGKPVIIENRGGAGGNIGIAAAARAGGDGYTLLACSSAYVVNPSLYAQATYDPFKDFVPVMVIGASPNALVVPAQSEIKSLPELTAKAKANPGKLNWTSPGAGTTPYLAGEVLKLRTGIEMQHIPFAGAGPATTAVLGARSTCTRPISARSWG